MGTAVGTFSARTNHRIRLETQLAGQSVAGNYSTINWQLYAEKTSSSSSYYLTNGGGGSVNIGGTAFGIAAWQYDFRSQTTILLGSGSAVINHNADGTASYNFTSSVTAPGSLGSASCAGSEGLPTIARATQPSVSPTSGDTGSAYTIGHNPASASFYHDIFYSLDGGGSYTQIASNVPGSTTSTSWTPAHTLLPNSSSITAVILLRTKDSSGGTVIGDKTVNLPLTVPASLVPVVSNVTWVDTQTASPDIPTLMGGAGRFVQGWSKLLPTVTSAGAGGSTVTSTAVTQAGQVTSSGTAFGAPVALSGAVPYSAIATDTRGRNSSPFTNTVPVTAYSYPSLPTPVVTRTSDAAGAVPSPTGTYLAITPLASVSSLLFGGVEKNLLEWQVRIKPSGGAFTTVQAWTAATVSGNTWTTKYVAAGPYASSTEWVVEVSIRDLFGKSGFNTASTISVLTVLVPSEQVFMDWDGNGGLGLGKYHANGMLDVAGAMYQNNGDPVISQGNADTLLPARLRPTNSVGSGGNPDTLTSTGWYSGYNWGGGLPAGVYGVGTLQVIQYSPDWITQTFVTAEASPQTVTRARYAGTTWGPWVRTITEALQPPLGLMRRTTSAMSTGNSSYANMSADAAWGSGELLGGMTYSNGFIVPKAGMYRVEWAMLVSGTTVGIMGIGVNVSSVGGQQLHAAGTLQNGGALFGNGSAMVRLAANDKLTFWGYGSGAAIPLNALAGQAPHWGVQWICP